MEAAARPKSRIPAPLPWMAVWGPGLLVMLADTDAGNGRRPVRAGRLAALAGRLAAGAGWFYPVYAACVVGAAALAVKALPEPLRLRGAYLWAVLGSSALVAAAGLFGGISGMR